MAQTTTYRQETKANSHHDYFITKRYCHGRKRATSKEFSKDNIQRRNDKNRKVRTIQAVQTEDYKAFAETQTDKTGTQHQTEISEQCVSRNNHNIASHEECAPNEEPPTMTNTQLETSHHIITEGIVATVTSNDDRSRGRHINFVKTRDWHSIKSSYDQYWYNVRNRLHLREDCLLIDERIVIPTQLRQTVLDSLHRTYPGSAAMLHTCQHVWFPHIHRSIVQMAKAASIAQSKLRFSNR